MTAKTLLQALDRKAGAGRFVRLWLRDDDATRPGRALDRLLDLTASRRIPLALAVIPEPAGPPLADRLRAEPHVSVAPHGWSHANHAGIAEKNAELSAHRGMDVVVDELRRGFDHLRRLFPRQFVPVLVPPWNRIAPEVVAALPASGFRALSAFGPDRAAALPMVNTHVDLIDWRGTRGGRLDADLMADLGAAVDRGGPVGLLSHHLVHDAQAWRFLDGLFDATADHPGCRWTALPDLLPSPGFPSDQQAEA